MIVRTQIHRGERSDDRPALPLWKEHPVHETPARPPALCLRRHRRAAPGADDATSQRLRRGIHLSINGIAAGLRNTG